MFYLYAIIASLCVGVFLFIGVSDKVKKELNLEDIYDPIEIFVIELFSSLFVAAVWPITMLVVFGYFLTKKVTSCLHNTNSF